VALKEEGIGLAAGRSGGYTRYDEIESCRVRLQSYPSAQFYTLEFATKNPDKFRIAGLVTRIALPKEVDLNTVLNFLRNKGVHVIEDPMK